MFTPGRIGMGTTVVGVTVQQSGLITFNVGDSRAYLLSSHGLTILSQDDVPETTEGGGRTRSTHEITQALGGSETPLAVLPHVSIRPALAEEDRLLLCTDGLTDVIDDSEIEGTLMLPAPSQVIVETLIRKAVRSGSRDNVSVLLLARAP
jgi:protein phosphatase